MRNTWVDQLRCRRMEVPIEDIPEPPAVAADEPPWWERVTSEDLRWAIEQLDEPYRSIAGLHDIDGHSSREIARLLAIQGATAATRLHRAHCRVRSLLRNKLGEERNWGGRQRAHHAPPTSPPRVSIHL